MPNTVYQKDKITRVQVKLRADETALKDELTKIKEASNSTISKLIMAEIMKMSKEQ